MLTAEIEIGYGRENNQGKITKTNENLMLSHYDFTQYGCVFNNMDE